MAELFSEIYGCYFTVVSRILGQAQNGLTNARIEELVNSYGFYESSFHMLPSLFSGEWNLLRKEENKYLSKLDEPLKRPFTTLECSWLKSLLSDERVKLFLDDEQLAALETSLTDIPALFDKNNFHIYDQHSNGDDFSDPKYIENFKSLTNACQSGIPVFIEYNNSARRTKRQYHIYKICYSERDNKFRLLCAVFDKKLNRLRRVTLNLSKIESVVPAEVVFDTHEQVHALYAERPKSEPVVLEISKERNALERCMLQFSSFEKQTEYDKVHDIYVCKLWFDKQEETEILIRVLSFGPVVRVLGPENFLAQIKERVRRQFEFNSL